ncbi:MAG: 2-oxoglutarate dehydrogenase E1 subunit family protein, partial [Rhodospirillales bacterium]
MSQIVEQTSFLSGGNAVFISELFARFVEDPASVDATWQSFFADLGEDERAVLHEARGASWAPNGHRIIGNGAAPEARANGAAKAANGAAATATVEDQRKA